LFKNPSGNLLVRLGKDSVKYPSILSGIKIKAGQEEIKEKLDTKNPDTNTRFCVVDEEHSILFPLRNKDTHPDYDLAIWFKNRQIAGFFRQLITNS